MAIASEIRNNIKNTPFRFLPPEPKHRGQINYLKMKKKRKKKK